MNLVLTMSATGLTPVDTPAVDQVDMIEINHFHDEHGRLVFDQIIFFDWSVADGRYQVRAWRLLKHPAQIPHRNWANGMYVATWYDGELLRKVSARSLRETWTQHDPELFERDFLPKEQRREFVKPRQSPRYALSP
jgi:hypothetical protein